MGCGMRVNKNLSQVEHFHFQSFISHGVTVVILSFIHFQEGLAAPVKDGFDIFYDVWNNDKKQSVFQGSDIPEYAQIIFQSCDLDSESGKRQGFRI